MTDYSTYALIRAYFLNLSGALLIAGVIGAGFYRWGWKLWRSE